MFSVVLDVVGEHKDVILIYKSKRYITLDVFHHAVECRGRICDTKWRHFEIEVIETADKFVHLLAFFIDADLTILSK